jgi:hypothetical protein
MKRIYQFFNLAPAPIFFLGFIWSLIDQHNICGHSWQMPVMWLVMFMAHLTPWFMFLQQRHFTRN